MDKKIEMLKNLGFEVEIIDNKVLGTKIVMAYRDTKRGTIYVALGDNGTARVVKPNGTIKWLYDKSDAQIRRALVQTIEANTYGGR